ncbi:MAG: alkaline phosphatase family protein [Gracilimonas sp.]|uniref:alkaline phosphatase family protein n=1 Tax=Gracilimonas sp. TaxID=1974203 RepID=UPI0019B5275F|nr:ectonucleotide pyrophosphatase/phosphodiesterase [Gracilimonas sp.]MBD3616937.1 alkaline phosphatase family protein [Gracilimonas sp.]
MKNYFLSLFILLMAFGCTAQQPESEKLLLVSFDGFRHDYLTKAETPNFDKLVETGVISEGLIPIFPSKTFPNHYAIATGLYPENNGFVGNNMYDPEMDARFTIRDREAVENPAWYEGEPIWNTVEKAGKKAGTMFWVGSETPIQDMRPTHWKVYDESMKDSARIDTVVKWLSYDDPGQVDFATLYFHFVDTQGHWYGPDSPQVIEAIKRADELVGYLIQRMNEEALTDITNLMIVSDHGMAEVSQDKIVVLDDMINPDDLEVVAYSPALMANVKGDKLDEVYTALKQNEEHFKVYKKENIPERYHLKNHPRVPELLLVADLGYTINSKEYFDAREDYPSGGAHGFDNREKEMHAIFVANGPDFKKGYQMKSFENIHLYDLMATLLNIKPANTDGSIDSVSVMLN